jgi:hypothetical protein
MGVPGFCQPEFEYRWESSTSVPRSVAPMSYLKSNPLRRNIHISSDRRRSMLSRSHKMWAQVNVCVKRGRAYRPRLELAY